MYGGLSIDQVFQKAREAGIPDEYTYRRVASDMETTRRLSTAASESTLPQPKKKGFLHSMASAIFKPAVDYAKLVGGGFIQAPVLALSGGKVNIPIMSNEELEKFSTPRGAITEGAKRTAGMMSYFIPGGGSTEAMAARGALAGGMYGFSQDQPIAESALLGAAGGVAVPKILGGASKVLEKVKGGGTAMRAGVMRPEVPVSPSMFDREQALVEWASNKGLKGSAQDIKSQMPSLYKSFIDQKNAILEGSTVTRPGVAIKRELAQKVMDTTGIDISSGANKRTFDMITSRLKGRVTEKVLDDVEVKASKIATRTFNPNYTPVERTDIARAIYDGIDDIIVDQNPALKAIKGELSIAKQLMPGIAKSAKATVPIPFTGMRVGAGGVQKVTEGTGRLLEKVGGAGKYLKNLPGAKGPTIAGAEMPGPAEFLGRRMFVGQKPGEGEIEYSRNSVIQGLMAQGIIDPREIKSALDEQTQAQGLGDSDFTIKEIKDRMENVLMNAPASSMNLEGVPETPGGLGAKGPLTKEKAAMLMLKYPKQATLIQNIYKMYNPPVNAQLQGKVQDAEAGLRLLGKLKAKYQEVQAAGLTATGPFAGRLAGLRGTAASLAQSSPEAAAYADSISAFMSRLSRAAGEKGVLTDQDIKRIQRAVPTFYDTEQTASQKWQLIEDIIGSAIATGTTKMMGEEAVPESPQYLYTGGGEEYP